VPYAPALSSFQPKQRLDSVLNQLNLFAIFNHPSGFFAEAEAQWYAQSNEGYTTPPEPGDEFWQFNAYAGYRFPRRKAEVRLGLLNITDQDYRLSPLNLYNELPRARTLTARLQINF
jgi:outer membrane receptor for ferric coprogen and ferric-rhodotorulic acid